MQATESIASRRSIRRFTDADVSDELVAELLAAAVLAPSAGNRQPWRFVVATDAAKAAVVAAMQAGAAGAGGLGVGLEGLSASIATLERAPVVVLVFNGGVQPQPELSPVQEHLRVNDLVSVGAAVQNLLLRATDLGLGSVWIGWVAIAAGEIRRSLGRREELLAAVALGHPGEAPGPRPRMPIADVVDWRSSALGASHRAPADREASAPEALAASETGLRRDSRTVRGDRRRGAGVAFVINDA